jgi:hypothetical protein
MRRASHRGSDAFSPTMIEGALVLEPTIEGMMEACE